MSDLSEQIEEQRARVRRPGRRRKRRPPKRALSPRGGIGLGCGCRWLYSGGAWRHVTPCRVHELEARPVTDLEMKFIAWSES